MVWLVIAVVFSRYWSVMTQQKFDNTLHNLHGGVNDLGDAFDAIDAQTASLDEIGVEALATAQEVFCVSDSTSKSSSRTDASRLRRRRRRRRGDRRRRGHGREQVGLPTQGPRPLARPRAARAAGVRGAHPAVRVYGGLTKSPRLLEHWAARWACFVVACLAVLLAFEFGVLVKVSDFCVAPDANFRDLVDRRIAISSADAELVDYYVSCGGANPLLAPLNNSLAEITFLDDAAALALATGACAPAASLEELRVLMAAADAQLDAVQTAAACDAVTPIYQDLVHDTLCRKFVRA